VREIADLILLLATRPACRSSAIGTVRPSGVLARNSRPRSCFNELVMCERARHPREIACRRSEPARVLRIRQAAGLWMKSINSSTLSGPQGAAIDRVIRIALDVKMLERACSSSDRRGAVPENATGDRTIRAGVAVSVALASLTRVLRRALQWGRTRASPKLEPAIEAAGGVTFKGIRPRHISHAIPLHVLADRLSLYPSGKGYKSSQRLVAGTHACLFFCYA